MLVIVLIPDCSKAANRLEYAWVAKLLRYEITERKNPNKKQNFNQMKTMTQTFSCMN